MKVGDRIRLDVGGYCGTDLKDFSIEEFRHTLGVFTSENARTAGQFTPICEMYDRGPDSVNKYLSNWGEYISNQVPMFMNLPKGSNTD